MTATKPKQPVAYSGSGSAIDNYKKPSAAPLEIKERCDSWGAFDKKNPKHKVILSLLYQAQWTEPSEKYGAVPDLERFSDFLKSDKSPVKMPLKKMNEMEIEKVIKALSGIVKSRYYK